MYKQTINTDNPSVCLIGFRDPEVVQGVLKDVQGVLQGFEWVLEEVLRDLQEVSENLQSFVLHLQVTKRLSVVFV